jgi:hypothetical protein
VGWIDPARGRAREGVFVLHVGLDLSGKQVEVCLISDQGELIDRYAAIPNRDGLYGLARRVAVYGGPVRGVVESQAPFFVWLPDSPLRNCAPRAEESRLAAASSGCGSA